MDSHEAQEDRLAAQRRRTGGRPAEDPQVANARLVEGQRSGNAQAAEGRQADEPQRTDDVQAGNLGLAGQRESGADVVAVVEGRSVSELPADLYIPPDALVVFLETFEGPLDLLLYLIRRRNLDLLELSVSEITDQYMGYIGLMKVLDVDLAGEYLAMAATLTAIKSSLLLPRHAETDEEADPRAELIRRLQEYERIKAAAEQLDALPRMERDVHPVQPQRPELIKRYAQPTVDLREVLVALAEVLQRAERFRRHAVQGEALSVRERMANVLARLSEETDFVPFAELFKAEEGRAGVVVTFLAITELLREGLVEFTQSAPFAPIYLQGAGVAA